MKKIVYGIASLTLAASILGACSNGEATTTNKNEDTKQETTAQANVKELNLTSSEDKTEHDKVSSFAASVDGKSEKEKNEVYKAMSKDSAATSMLDKVVRYGFKDSTSPVSEYQAFLNTYTGKNNYKYTEDNKKQAEKVWEDVNAITEQYKKDTGAKDLSNVTASLSSDAIKLKDEGNNDYTVTAKVSVLGDAGNKEYTIVSNATYNNVIGYMQAKDIKIK
jgi:adenine-specific DNA methylase